MRQFRIALLALLFLVVGSVATKAATFTVDRFEDANGPCTPGDCSLREALLAAEATPESDTVVVPAGVHTLSLPETSPGSLSGGDLDVLLFDVEVIAPSGATIDAQGIDRVFRFLQSTSRLENLIITGGRTSDLGGGVYGEQSDLELHDLWIRDNLARRGGGLAIEVGTVSLTNSTISGNTATASGGGIYVFGISTVILGRLETLNSTISGNEAMFAGGAIQLTSAAELLLGYTTIANNTNRDGDPTIFGFLFDPRADAVHTLMEGTCTAGPDTACIYQTSRTDELPVIDLGLAPLALNGGMTPTHHLLSTSPAVDLVPVTASCPATDQRGFARPEDGDGDSTASCDAGAYELGLSPVAIPTLSATATLVCCMLVGIGGLALLRR